MTAVKFFLLILAGFTGLNAYSGEGEVRREEIKILREKVEIPREKPAVEREPGDAEERDVPMGGPQPVDAGREKTGSGREERRKYQAPMQSQPRDWVDEIFGRDDEGAKRWGSGVPREGVGEVKGGELPTTHSRQDAGRPWDAEGAPGVEKEEATAPRALPKDERSGVDSQGRVKTTSPERRLEGISREKERGKRRGSDLGARDLPREDRLLAPVGRMPPRLMGGAALRSPDARPKTRFVLDLYGGRGDGDTLVGSASANVRVFDWIIGVAEERAQWLDEKTNTGKYTKSTFLDLCAALAFRSFFVMAQPCYRAGFGEGIYKHRNALDEVETHSRSRSVSRVYARFVFSTWKGGPFVEGVSGYSEDVFLYGPYTQAWVKIPSSGLSIGYEDFAGQRRAVMLGAFFGALDIGK